jgi:hypothetical protein
MIHAESSRTLTATVPVGWGAHQNDDVGGAYGRFCGHDKDGGLVHVNWRPGSEGRERADRELIFIAGISQRKNEIVWDECYMSAMVGHDNNTGVCSCRYTATMLPHMAQPRNGLSISESGTQQTMSRVETPLIVSRVEISSSTKL